MRNDELLFTHNKHTFSHKLNLYKKNIEYRYTRKNFDGEAISDIINFCNLLQTRYSSIKIPIIFNLGKVKIEDKLTYILFECICAYLIKHTRRKVCVFLQPKRTIWTDGIESSPLLLLNDMKNDTGKFLARFQKDIYKNHYRRIISFDDDNIYLLSEIMDEIDSFLKPFDVSSENRKEFAEVAVELIGNAREHAISDCLIDLDVTEVYTRNDTGEDCYGVNLVVLNFSNTLLGDNLKSKIKRDETLLNDRHKTILHAFEYHKKHFTPNYKEDDFFNIASFQHKVSGRFKNTSTGGTGLTKLILSLENKSDAHKCYMLSGGRGLWFNKDYLEYNLDGWIGFNKNQEFLNDVPDTDCITQCSIFMPGTAYNLNFALKKEN